MPLIPKIRTHPLITSIKHRRPTERISGPLFAALDIRLQHAVRLCMLTIGATHIHRRGLIE